MKNMDKTEEKKEEREVIETGANVPQGSISQTSVDNQADEAESTSPDLAVQGGADSPAKAASGRQKKRNGKRGGILGALAILILFLILNGLFVFATVDFLLKNKKYLGETANNAGQIQVVEEESQTINVAQKASPAVVSIIATAEVPKYETLYRNFFDFQIPSQVQNGTEEKQISAGSGFIVSSDGYIITNKHVVEDESAKYTVILHDEKHKDEKIEAEVVARDPNENRDIAILKISKTDLPYLNLGDSNNIKVGQTAIAIGYALGQFDNTVSKGVVSGLSRSISASGTQAGSEDLKNLIQIDTAVNPGNSGGPLLDLGGNVIGLNVAMAEAQSIAFAIPINEVRTDYDQARNSGSIQKEAKAFLGVRAATIDDSVQKQNNLPYNYGAIIVRGQNVSDLAVVPGSPADKAGLVENDIILEVNGEKVTDKNLLTDLIGKYKPGDQVKLKIYHKGEEKEITVTLGENK